MANQALIERHRIRVTGPRDATRSIVFIHGFGLTGESWQAVLPRFETEFRVVCYDRAGAGAPPKAQLPQQHYLNLDRYVADLLEVCDGLTLERPALVGHSVGGMIAALATLARPGRFSRLVLVGASPCYRNHDAYVGGFDDEALNRTYQAVLHQHEP
jgi:sigma-B regulation protein RsbQ